MNTYPDKTPDVGIFTLTHALNYGAFYQMYAVAKFLEGEGCRATVFDCQKSFRQRLLRHFSYHPVRQYRKLKLAREYARDRREVRISRYKGEALDLAVLGSDEIWNLENRSFENAPEYVGRNIDARRKIAYAPSLGYADPKALVADDDFAAALRDLDEIFPRDGSTRGVAETITGKTHAEVSDPTFLLDNWRDIASDRFAGEEPYLVYYGYTGKPGFKAAMQEYARQQGLPILTAGFRRHDWCDRNLLIGPRDFLSLIKHSHGTFTDTFHGFLLTTLLEKPLVFGTPQQKIADIARKLGMQDWAMTEQDTASDVAAAQEADQTERQRKLADMRAISREKLGTYISRGT